MKIETMRKEANALVGAMTEVDDSVFVTSVSDGAKAAVESLATALAATLEPVDKAYALRKATKGIGEQVSLASGLNGVYPLDGAIAILARLQAAIAQHVKDAILQLFPKYGVVGAAALHATGLDGAGVKVALIDRFDQNLLTRQGAAASIEAAMKVGTNEEMDHGNEVLECLLGIAPKATIVPVFVEDAAMPAAMDALLQRDDILIVNMSRGLPQNQESYQALARLAARKIVVKSLGNKGIELQTDVVKGRRLNPRNAALETPIQAGIDSDEDSLPEFIKTTVSEHDHLIFAVNLEPDGADIFPGSNTPGADARLQSRAVGVPATMLSLEITGGIESGTSYAAPQIAGVAALLVQQALKKPVPPTEIATVVTSAIKAACERPATADPKNMGLGLLRADRAAEKKTLTANMS